MSRRNRKRMIGVSMVALLAAGSVMPAALALMLGLVVAAFPQAQFPQVQAKDLGKTIAGLPTEGPLASFMGEPKYDIQQLYSLKCRFPNALVATDGTVLALIGHPWHGKERYVKVRRSEDGGKTWGSPIIVFRGKMGGGCTVNEATGEIVAFSNGEISRSRNNGKTWSALERFKNNPDVRGNQLAMHMNESGITLRHGDHVGRLIRAARAGGTGRLPASVCRDVRALANQRDDLLAFAAQLDQDLAVLAVEFQVAVETARAVLNVELLPPDDPSRWPRKAALRNQLGNRYFPLSVAMVEVAHQTVRASSLVENLNSRLRNYFFLRRHLGPDYSALLQFFLNHRRFLPSERPERVGKSPAELLKGSPHLHWLEMLGYVRFSRN